MSGAEKHPKNHMIKPMTAEDVAKEMGHNAVAELCAVSPRKGYGTTCHSRLEFSRRFRSQDYR